MMAAQMAPAAAALALQHNTTAYSNITIPWISHTHGYTRAPTGAPTSQPTTSPTSISAVIIPTPPPTGPPTTPPPTIPGVQAVYSVGTDETSWLWWVIIAAVGFVACWCMGVMCYSEQRGESTDPRVMDCFNSRDGHSCWYKLCYFIWYYVFLGCLCHKSLHSGKEYNPRRTNPQGDCWYNTWFCVWYTALCGCFCNAAPAEMQDDGLEMKDEQYAKPSFYARSAGTPGQM